MTKRCHYHLMWNLRLRTSSKYARLCFLIMVVFITNLIWISWNFDESTSVYLIKDHPFNESKLIHYIVVTFLKCHYGWDIQYNLHAWTSEILSEFIHCTRVECICMSYSYQYWFHFLPSSWTHKSSWAKIFILK